MNKLLKLFTLILLVSSCNQPAPDCKGEYVTISDMNIKEITEDLSPDIIKRVEIKSFYNNEGQQYMNISFQTIGNISNTLIISDSVTSKLCTSLISGETYSYKMNGEVEKFILEQDSVKRNYTLSISDGCIKKISVWKN